MATRSFNDAVDALLAFIQAANNRISLVVGSTYRDIVESVGQEFAKAYVLQEWSRRQGSTALLRRTLQDAEFKDQLLRSLPKGSTADDVEMLISEAIDAKAANVGVSRTAARKAKIVFRLQRATSGTGITITAGSVTAQTSAIPPVAFTNTESIINGATSFDAITNLFYIDVQAEAVEAGASGNVAAGTVRTLTPQIGDFSSVTNPSPSEGGSDEQSDSALLDAIEASLLGINLNTIGGYPKAILAFSPDVFDAEVVDPSNPLLQRLPVGAADIYIIGEISKTITDTYVFLGEDIVLRKQPVLQVDSVISFGSTTQTFVQGVDFVFVKDTANFAGSVRAQDRIAFLSGQAPVVGTALTITYRQNRLIEDIQTFLTDKPDTTVVGADVLIKEGVKVLINMIMHITPLPEFSTVEVQASVSDNLAAFLGERKLGQGAFYSDLIGVIEDTEGLDRVDVPFALLARAGQAGNSDIPVAANEYVRANSIQFI
jgi:hypothetical protein